jgi:hypothetical protein
MSRHSYEANVLANVASIQASLEKVAYTETLHFPGFNVATPATAIWQAPAGKRARIRAMGCMNVSTAITTTPLLKAGTSGTTDAQLSNITLPPTSARTSASVVDTAADLERLMLVGTVSRVAAAAQLFQLTSTTGGGTGIFDLVVVVDYLT